MCSILQYIHIKSCMYDIVYVVIDKNENCLWYSALIKCEVGIVVICSIHLFSEASRVQYNTHLVSNV